MKNYTQLAQNAAESAYKDLRRMMGISEDPNVRFYQTLKQEDFDAIQERYGMMNTAEYIDRMERELMKRG